MQSKFSHKTLSPWERPVSIRGQEYPVLELKPGEGRRSVKSCDPHPALSQRERVSLEDSADRHHSDILRLYVYFVRLDDRVFVQNFLRFS